MRADDKLNGEIKAILGPREDDEEMDLIDLLREIEIRKKLRHLRKHRVAVMVK